MINIETIQLFLKKINPNWSFVKIAFISYLMLNLLKRNESLNSNYIVIKTGSNYKIWQDKVSNTFALEQNEIITPFDTLDELNKFI